MLPIQNHAPSPPSRFIYNSAMANARGFSVIIPTYNRAYILGRAIRSVLSQTGEHDFEVLIIDDGSTDDTAFIIKSFGDSRIKYFRQDNKGPSAARNLALSYNTKEWITYLDSDNEFYPHYFDTLARYLENNEEALYVMVRAVKVDELYKDGQLVKRQEDKKGLPENITLEDLITFHKVFFDTNGFAHGRKVADEGLRWDEKIKGVEDWEFLIQIAEKHPGQFLYIPDPIVHYHRTFGTDGIISNSTYGDWADMYEYIYQKHKNNTLMQGQTWYPAQVEAYRKNQKDFEDGKIPAQHERWFQ